MPLHLFKMQSHQAKRVSVHLSMVRSVLKRSEPDPIKMLEEVGPPNEWSGAVAALLGEEKRKLLVRTWAGLSPPKRKKVLQAFNENFDKATEKIEAEKRALTRKFSSAQIERWVKGHPQHGATCTPDFSCCRGVEHMAPLEEREAFATAFKADDRDVVVGLLGRFLSAAMSSASKRGPLKPFSSPGGKEAWRTEILPRLAAHKTYVEPYAGSASIFWTKPKSEREVLADIDPDIVETYLFLRDGTDADFAWMRSREWGHDRKRFDGLKKIKPRDRRERVYRFKYLNLFSARGVGQNFADTSRAAGNTGGAFLKNLEKFRERLQGVKIHRRDALAVMKAYDGPDTFFYLDPPWKAVGAGEQWRNFDGAKFASALGSLRGKALVSYQGDLSLGKRWTAFTIASAMGGVGKLSKQQLFANYAMTSKGEDMLAKIAGEGGMHLHELDRANSQTAEDGIHRHLFAVGGEILVTAPDGAHRHELASADADEAKEAAGHTHMVKLPDGSELETEPAEPHGHELQVKTSALDGLHQHTLKLPTGETVSSLTPGEFFGQAEPTEPEPEEPEAEEQSKADELFAVADLIFKGDDKLSRLERLYRKILKRDIRVVCDKQAAANDERFALGIVLEPEVVDAQGDIYSAAEIRKAAHGFMEFHRNAGLMHDELVNDKVVILESYVALADFEIVDPQGVTQKIPKGTWLMGKGYRDDELWRKVKTGELSGLSIGGSAVRRPRAEAEAAA